MSSSMENTVEFYYEKLKTTDTPGRVLAALMCSLYSKDVTKAEIILCNGLLKAFGRFTVFFAIVDMAGTYPEGVEHPRAMLYTIAKKRFENAHIGSTIQARESLDSFLSNLEKQISKVEGKKLKIPSSKGLDADGSS